jgi:hypothetical protein
VIYEVGSYPNICNSEGIKGTRVQDADGRAGSQQAEAAAEACAVQRW